MKIHTEFEQNTEEWLSFKLGKISGSEAGAFMIEEKKTLYTIDDMKEHLDELEREYKSKWNKSQFEAACDKEFLSQNVGISKTARTARTALYAKKIAERSGADLGDHFESFAIRRGNELEPVARRVYERLLGRAVHEVGFIEHDNGLMGCSPDGVIFDSQKNIEGIFETKSHMPGKHVYYRIVPSEFEDEHKHQVHWNLALSGAKWCELFAYCPKLPYIRRKIYRNAYTDRFVDAIDELSGEYKAAIEQYNSIYAKQREELAIRKAQAA